MPQDYGNDRNINYVNRDFQGIKSDLMQYIRTYYPDSFGDFNETSTGMMLLELVAYVGDVLNFYIDEQFKELMLPTVSERRNVINIARTLGYRVKPSVPSLVEIEVSQLVPAIGDSLDRRPDFGKCLVIDAGMTLGSGTSDNQYQTLDVVDFTISGSVPPEEFATDADGLVDQYKLRKKVLAASGTNKEMKFTIGQSIPFRRITLPEDNVTAVLDVTDIDGNKWYQVDYLSQDRVFTDSHYLTGERATAYTDLTGDISGSVAAPYQLDAPFSTNKRYTIETNEDNTTSIIFGNGLVKTDLSGTTILEDLYLENQDVNSIQQGNLPGAINPLENINYNSLGESPAHTTMTIKYRIGGGVNSNVPINDIRDIAAKNVLQGTAYPATVGSLAVKNTSPARGGKGGESINEIRSNTKAFFSTQNRCVTKEDYEARILSLPGKYGSVAKCFATRFPENTDFGTAFNLDTSDADNTTIIGGTADAVAFQNMIQGIADQGSISEGGTDYSPQIAAINNFITAIPSLGGNISNVATHKNIDVYVLAYDHKKYLCPTNDVTKSNLANFISRYKSITDMMTIKDGIVINFGILFDVVAHKSYNKSELKLKILEKYKSYFNIDKMIYNQIIYISDLENIAYGIEGVKYVNHVKVTQNGSTLGHGIDLRNSSGIPMNGVAGVGTEAYGFGYNFEQFQAEAGGDGVIRPAEPTGGSPSIFELKNPDDNIRGVVS